MAGWFGSIVDWTHGDIDPVEKSDIFKDADLGALGGMYSKMLQTPAIDQPQFGRNVNYLRDLVGRETSAAQRNLGESATRRGFFDSGAVTAGSLAIDRAGQGALSEQVTNLINFFEQQRWSGILPFLSLGLQEDQGVQGMNLQAQIAERQQNADKSTAIMQSIMGMYGGGCWVAAELYGGWYAPRTVKARLWLHTLAPEKFRSFYLRHGRRWAELIRQDQRARQQARRFFDRIVGA